MSVQKLKNTKSNIKKIKRLYFDEEVSVKNIAKMFQVGQTTMFRFFDRNNIKTRTRKEAYEIKHLSELQIKRVWELYYEGKNREEIAQELKVSYYSVRLILDYNGIGQGKKHSLRCEKNTPPLTYEEKQLILGSLLGDASLGCREKDGCKNQLELSICHCNRQLGYIQHIANILDCNIKTSLVSKNEIQGHSVAEHIIHKISYSNKYELLKIRKLCHNGKRKYVSTEWLKEIDPTAIAYWFMDDGCSVYTKCKSISVMLATQSFDADEHILLQNRLLDFGIETILRHNVGNGTGLNIYIRQKSVNSFMDLIEPTVSKI